MCKTCQKNKVILDYPLNEIEEKPDRIQIILDELEDIKGKLNKILFKSGD